MSGFDKTYNYRELKNASVSCKWQGQQRLSHHFYCLNKSRLSFHLFKDEYVKRD